MTEPWRWVRVAALSAAWALAACGETTSPPADTAAALDTAALPDSAEPPEDTMASPDADAPDPDAADAPDPDAADAPGPDAADPDAADAADPAIRMTRSARVETKSVGRKGRKGRSEGRKGEQGRRGRFWRPRRQHHPQVLDASIGRRPHPGGVDVDCSDAGHSRPRERCDSSQGDPARMPTARSHQD